MGKFLIRCITHYPGGVHPIRSRAEDGKYMASCLIAWYNMYQEENKIMRGHLEISFNDILHIRMMIGRYNKEGEIDDYVRTFFRGNLDGQEWG